MQLSFASDHISIRPFDAVELPDLVVLTGRNGSGKTHLLEAIRHGASKLDDFQPHEIQYFNYQNFVAQNANGQNVATIDQITNQEFAEYQQNFLPALQVLYQNLAQQWVPTKNFADADSFYETIDDFWKSKPRNKAGAAHLITLREAVLTWLEASASIPRTSQYPAIWSVIQKSVILPHLIDRSTFGTLFVPILDAGSILGFSISTLFSKYKIEEFNWCHNEFSAGRSGNVKKSQADYRKRTPPPWIAINDLLSQMGKMSGSRDTFKFEVTTPDEQLIEIQNVQNFTFLAQLRNRNTGAICNFDQLSSGEKVLLALTCSIYYANDLMMLPRALLLDEVDASLHPSMIRTLLDAIQSAFIERGSKVILATHSPTTVGLAPLESLYFVEAGAKQKKVRKTSKKEALELLSEGFVTFDEGLDALRFSGERMVIFTEGHNRKIISRYLDIIGVNGIKIIDSLDDKTGKEQLAHYYRAISVLGLNRAFLFVWDCDGTSVTGKLEESNSLFKYVIPHNPNNDLTSKGIENAFSPSLFGSFCKTTTLANGSVIRGFDEAHKKAFADKIVKSGSLEDFSCLDGLRLKIEGILGRY